MVPYAVDAASFAASAALLTRLPRGLRASGDHTAPIGRAVKDGLLWLARHRRLRTPALLAAAANLAYNCAWAVFVFYATDQDGLAVTDTGFGSADRGPRHRRCRHRPARRPHHPPVSAERALVIGVAAHAAAWPIIATTGSPWVAAPLLAAIGACQTLITTVNAGLRQLPVPAAMLGRVIAGFRTVANSASPAGAVLGALIAAGAGLRAPMVTTALGVILVLSSTTSVFWLPPEILAVKGEGPVATGYVLKHDDHDLAIFWQDGRGVKHYKPDALQSREVCEYVDDDRTPLIRRLGDPYIIKRPRLQTCPITQWHF
ncbi:hypothetical protein [Micromonospora sp. NPDC049171]|uniref:hypothetical protein n=1 Tax=Micromonospora sp. NPDC049171 TaxID=3155770 RepID=UPI0033C605E8